MKKYGKYERMTDGTRAKQPGVKTMLLQTYFTSLLCMVLCVTMFFGTTFAWFTSEVENSGNEIYIGTLDAKLEMLKKINGVDTWINVEDEAHKDVKLFDGNIRWEPGYTAMETIKVSNEGDLAFRYEMTFTNPDITENKKDAEFADKEVWLSEVAKHFVVYVHEGAFDENDAAPTSFEEIRANANNEDETKRTWRVVKNGAKDATLADILNGDLILLSGKMNKEDVRKDTTDPNATLPGPNDSKNTEHTYIIALHMNGEKMPEGLTESGQKKWQNSINALMGHKISLNVKLTAYQQTSEQDAFDANYDLEAFVNTLAEVNQLEDKNISYYWGTSDRVSKSAELAVKYQFRPTETVAEAEISPYRYYHADYVVSANKDIPAEAVALAGYYTAWCDNNVINNHWIGLYSEDEIKAGQEIRLVDALGVTVNYEELCYFGNDGVGFLCGLWDLSAENGNPSAIAEDTTITVQLRLYETTGDPSTESGPKNIETGRYIVVGEYTYTFPGATTP